jgi:hypothetical protein
MVVVGVRDSDAERNREGRDGVEGLDSDGKPRKTVDVDLEDIIKEQQQD